MQYINQFLTRRVKQIFSCKQNLAECKADLRLEKTYIYIDSSKATVVSKPLYNFYLTSTMETSH